jgi:hypothetical protein
MNIFNKKYLIVLALSTLLVPSCSESFLEEVNPNTQTPSTFWISEENVLKGLSAVYNPLRRMTSGYYGGFEGILHYQMRADDTYPTRGEEEYIWEVLSFTNTPNTGTNCWSNIYTGIQIANEFLYNAPNVDMDADELSEMLGEAYFMRGFWYFRVCTDFNEGVIRTLPQSVDPESHGLSSREEVLAQAISDFKEAKARLPKTRTADENGRVTQGAAIAMLGKAYLWNGDYEDAKTELETIMTGYGYDLTDEYEDNFRDDTEFNEESIFEINYEALGNSSDAWGNSTSDNSFMGNVLGHYFGPSIPNSQGATGQNLGGGWYKMQPSPYLIRQFIAEPRPEGSDTRWDKRLYTTCFFKYSDYNDTKADDTYFDGFTFDELFQKTTQPQYDDKYRIKSGWSPDYPDIDGKEGRFMMKKLTPWWCKSGCTMYSNNAGRITNFRIMRFAEVLFLHAEACLETGDNASAMADINRIRVRAGLPEKNLTDKDSIMEELRNQKLLEFAGENIRWDDLVRWYDYDELKSIMIERKTDTKIWETQTASDGSITYVFTGKVEDTQNFENFQEKHMFLPIPQSEVDANLNLEQKEEWQ